MSSDLAPYATHPDMPQFHAMVRESRATLEAIGDEAEALDIRLLSHPSQFAVLTSPDSELVRKSIWDLLSQAEMLDQMELDPEAVLVIHSPAPLPTLRVAGGGGSRPGRRCPSRYSGASSSSMMTCASPGPLSLDPRAYTSARLIRDYQPFWCLNPEGAGLVKSAEPFCGRGRSATGKKTAKHVPPVEKAHADNFNPFEFATYMRDVAHLNFRCSKPKRQIWRWCGFDQTWRDMRPMSQRFSIKCLRLAISEDSTGPTLHQCSRAVDSPLPLLLD